MQEVKQNNWSFLAFYWLFLIGFFVVLNLCFWGQLDWSNAGDSNLSFLIAFSAFDWFFLELILVLLIGGLCIQGNVLFRLIAYSIALGFFLLNTLQATAFYQTSKFVSKLATENMNHASIIMNGTYLLILIFFLMFFSTFVILVERRKNIKISSKHNLRSTFVTLSVLSLAITIPNAFALWPDGLVKQRNHFLAQHQLQHYSPMWSLYDTLFIQSEEAVNISPQNLSTAKKYNFHFQPDVKYPLIKDIIYHGQAPFTKKITQSSNSGSTSQQPNIIIFFTEGFSSRTSNVYGSAYTDITPFLNDFAQHADSMVIDNYYNHTAATYRGLHGQLCSIYPKYGGHGGWHDNYASLPKTDYFCLSHLFNNYNYETMFLHSQFRDTTFIDEMMQILTFNQVWTADSLSKKYLSDQVPLRSNAISDQQLFRGLVGLLKDLEKQQNSSDSNTNKPFFLNIYNFETHAMLDVKEDGKTYGEGDNISLNTIHNLDDAFGKFWKYFQQSPLAENTIVIFTADHCHYHEKVYVEAVNKPGSGYQSIFVDQIPLIIHDPTRKLPSHFDANYASSIDFAPSLVHYLTLPNHINAFMGRSIFEQSRQDQSQTVHVQTKGLASFGRETFLIDKDKIHGGLNFTGSHKETLSDLRQFVRHVQWLEGQNRIWDTNLNVVIQQTIGKQQRVAKSWNN